MNGDLAGFGQAVGCGIIAARSIVDLAGNSIVGDAVFRGILAQKGVGLVAGGGEGIPAVLAVFSLLRGREGRIDARGELPRLLGFLQRAEAAHGIFCVVEILKGLGEIRIGDGIRGLFALVALAPVARGGRAVLVVERLELIQRRGQGRLKLRPVLVHKVGLFEIAVAVRAGRNMVIALVRLFYAVQTLIILRRVDILFGDQLGDGGLERSHGIVYFFLCRIAFAVDGLCVGEGILIFAPEAAISSCDSVGRFAVVAVIAIIVTTYGCCTNCFLKFRFINLDFVSATDLYENCTN